MVNRWCTALSGRGGPGRLVAGGLGVSWLCLPLVAADDATTSCATFVIPIQSGVATLIIMHPRGELIRLAHSRAGCHRQSLER